MEKPKFTPGKWFVDLGVSGKPRVFTVNRLIKYKMICACEHGAKSRQYNDAALISTAPEMYYMLEDLLANCVINGIYREQAEAIMKKARGEK